eukprot:1765090-Rhodomonas_salina.1
MERQSSVRHVNGFQTLIPSSRTKMWRENWPLPFVRERVGRDPRQPTIGRRLVGAMGWGVKFHNGW